MYNVNFDVVSSTLLAKVGSIGNSASALLAQPSLLDSVFSASNFLKMFFSGIFEDVSFTKALENWLSLANEQKRPLDGTQKNWTIPVYVKNT